MRTKQEVEIMKPKPYEVVEAKFDLFGKIPKTWLSYGKYGLGVDWMDVKGNDLLMGGPRAEVRPNLFSRFLRKIPFHCQFDLTYFTPCEHPRGLIIEIHGEVYRNENYFYLLPLIIKGTNKIYENEYADLKVKLSKTLEKIVKLKADWKAYGAELAKVRSGVVYEKELLKDIFEMLDNSDEAFKPITESEYDKQEKAIYKKYKDVINWRGPLLGGVVGMMNGFEMRVHSDDHGKHFHVIHRGKGVNVRFSFPEIEVVSYASKTLVGSKTKQKIQEFCRTPEIQARLEKEFAKRT